MENTQTAHRNIFNRHIVIGAVSGVEAYTKLADLVGRPAAKTGHIIETSPSAKPGRKLFRFTYQEDGGL